MIGKVNVFRAGGYDPNDSRPTTPDVPGLEFFDAGSNRTMKYVYPDTPHWTAGWILYKHPDGQWVTLRKATADDQRRITKAVVEAHHSEDEA